MSAPEPAATWTADPAWHHNDQRGRRGASTRYRTMPTPEICALPLPPRAERNVLGLWALTNMPIDAAQVLDAWDYVQLAEMTWIKLRPCGTCCATGRVEVFSFGAARVLVPAVGPGVTSSCVRSCPDCADVLEQAFVGMGTTVRNVHEVVKICRPKRGQAPERLSRSIPSVFAAPMLVDIDGILDMRDKQGNLVRGLDAFVHSAKPERFYSEILPALYPPPYHETFSRRTRPGWTSSTSDQHDRLDEVARVMRDVWPARTREERLAAARRRAAR